MQAQLLQSLIYLQQLKFTEAEGVLNPIMRTNGGDADVLLTGASYWYMKENSGQIDKYLKAAMRVEPVLFKFDKGPNPLELLQFLQRKIHYRSGFYLSLGSLFKD